MLEKRRLETATTEGLCGLSIACHTVVERNGLRVGLHLQRAEGLCKLSVGGAGQAVMAELCSKSDDLDGNILAVRVSLNDLLVVAQCLVGLLGDLAFGIGNQQLEIVFAQTGAVAINPEIGRVTCEEVATP
ncbi:MAG: hypothetical protein AAGF95_27555 [Chloroflexota bacterium]